jgi:hypothetical protein
MTVMVMELIDVENLILGSFHQLDLITKKTKTFGHFTPNSHVFGVAREVKASFETTAK